MLKSTVYGSEEQTNRVLLVVPHGASGENFFKAYPQIFENPFIQEQQELFRQFVAVEQDRGSSELAHGIAQALSKKIQAKVLEIDYPRAIVDGGRQSSHCLRGFLPAPLLAELTPAFLRMHQSTIDAIRGELNTVRNAGGLMLDIHTMAPFTPEPMECCAKISEEFSNIQNYVEAFCDPEKRGYRRKLDLIVSCEEGKLLADPYLVECLQEGFAEYPVDMSIPFCAPSHFMMNEYMKTCPGIAIDVPKDFIADEGVDFCLESFHLDASKVARISRIVANQVEKTLIHRGYNSVR